MTYRTQFIWIWCLLFLGISPTIAAEESPESQDEKNKQTNLTITVVAEKRPEPMQEVPMSMSVLTQDTLASGQISSIEDASFYIPNLFVSGFSAKRTSFPFIRGIGSGLGDPAVTTYVDGVPQLSPNTTNIDLLGVERIEFLRGPQGSLYGRNTMGGVIHMLTAEPEDHFQGVGRIGLGSENEQRYQLAVNGPLGESGVRYSLGASSSTRDGYTQNLFNGESVDERESTFLRGQLLWNPSDNLKIRLGIYSQRDRDGGFTLTDLAGLADEPYQLSHDYRGQTDRDLTAPSLTVTYQTASYEIVSISSYEDWDAQDITDLDFSPADWLQRSTAEAQTQFYQEVRIASHEAVNLAGDANLHWLGGVSYFDSSFDHGSVNVLRPSLTQVPFPLEERAAYTLDDQSLSVFGQATLTLAQAFDLTLGMRYLDESQDATIDLVSQILPPPLDSAQQSPAADFDAWLPRLSLAYRSPDDWMAYASAAKGYRSGGYNRNTTPAGPFLMEEEDSWTYELGFKSTWLDERLLLNLAAFRIDWNNRQLEAPYPQLPGRYFLANIGEARSVGFEIEAVVTLAENWSAQAGYGKSDASFRGYIDPFTGTDVTGKQLPNVPENNWHLGLSHRRVLSGKVNLNARAELQGVGDMSYDNAGTRGQDAYVLANFRAALEFNKLSLEAWLKNAFDEEYVPIALPSNFSPSGFAGEIGPPRTFGLMLGYQF